MSRRGRGRKDSAFPKSLDQFASLTGEEPLKSGKFSRRYSVFATESAVFFRRSAIVRSSAPHRVRASRRACPTDAKESSASYSFRKLAFAGFVRLKAAHR